MKCYNAYTQDVCLLHDNSYRAGTRAYQSALSVFLLPRLKDVHLRKSLQKAQAFPYGSMRL